jgi:hypothetical protein
MKDMIVRLFGGMGNQMFQYAAARALSSRYERKLFLDTTLADSGKTRSYCLNVFELSADLVHPRWMGRAMFRAACSPKSAMRQVVRFLRQVKSLDFIEESHPYHLDQSLDARIQATERGATVCLQGYWQCPGYFADAEEMIRREFTFRTNQNSANRAMLTAITEVNSASLHIRRGDYLGLTNQPVLALEYYVSAAEVVASRVGNPHFFVFSDDIAWAKANLRLAQPMTFVDVNTEETACEDLRLMSACRHHIIANSTFSWWGAWLNPRQDKVVVAPKYWGCTRDSYYPNLTPSGWICLENI